MFVPASDWPAGQTFDIRFSKSTFAPTAKMERLNFSFFTQVFDASISDFKFYQDPVDAKIRQAVATLHFNFPVNPESLEHHTSLLFQTVNNDKPNSNTKPYAFNITYDKYKRTAYLRSESISLSDVARYLLLTLDEGIKSATGSDETRAPVSTNLLIPDNSSYFKVMSTAAMIVRNNNDRPEQILTLETSLGVTDADVKQSLHVYLLPQNYPATATEEEKKYYKFLLNNLKQMIRNI